MSCWTVIYQAPYCGAHVGSQRIRDSLTRGPDHQHVVSSWCSIGSGVSQRWQADLKILSRLATRELRRTYDATIITGSMPAKGVLQSAQRSWVQPRL